MSLAQQFTNVSEEVMEYLFNQKIRERNLIAEKDKIAMRLHKIEDCLELLQNRDDDQTCMIAAGNLYHLTTVKLVRESLQDTFALDMIPYQKLHRKILRLQKHIQEDHTALYDSLIRTPST